MEIPELPIHDDLWGKFYRDHYENDATTYYIRRDDGFLDKCGIGGYFRTLRGREAEALEDAKGHVLDVGCEVGAGILWLQEKGLRVIGVDLSPGAVGIARKRGAQDARAMSLWDVPQMKERFDTVILMGNNTGLAGSLEKTGEMLEMLRGITNDGAVLIGDTINPVETSDPGNLAYHKWNTERGRYIGQVSIRTEYGGFTEPWFDIVLFEPDVLKKLCQAHGWKPRETITQGPGYFLIADKVG